MEINLPIILGSSSIWRQQLLREAGLIFTIMPPNIDESSFQSNDASVLALSIAKAKTQALLPQIVHPALLITSDLIVACGDNIYGKPRNKQEATLFLKSYRKYPAVTHNAIVITRTDTTLQQCFVDRATVHFHPIPDEIISSMVLQADIFHCAGAFQIENNALFSPYIMKVEGDIDSVKGLPLSKTMSIMHELSLAN